MPFVIYTFTSFFRSAIATDLNEKGSIFFLYWPYASPIGQQIVKQQPFISFELSCVIISSAYERIVSMNATLTKEPTHLDIWAAIRSHFPINQLMSFDELHGALAHTAKPLVNVSFAAYIEQVGDLETKQAASGKEYSILKLLLHDVSSNQPSVIYSLFGEEAMDCFNHHKKQSLIHQCVIGWNLEASLYTGGKTPSLNFKNPGIPKYQLQTGTTQIISVFLSQYLHGFFYRLPQCVFPDVQARLTSLLQIQLIEHPWTASPNITTFSKLNLPTSFSQKQFWTDPSLTFDTLLSFKKRIQLADCMLKSTCWSIVRLKLQALDWYKWKCTNKSCFGHNSYMKPSKDHLHFICQRCNTTLVSKHVNDLQPKYEIPLTLCDATASINTTLQDWQALSFFDCTADQWLTDVTQNRTSFLNLLSECASRVFLAKLESSCMVKLDKNQVQHLDIRYYLKSFVPMGKLSAKEQAVAFERACEHLEKEQMAYQITLCRNSFIDPEDPSIIHS